MSLNSVKSLINRLCDSDDQCRVDTCNTIADKHGCHESVVCNECPLRSREALVRAKNKMNNLKER